MDGATLGATILPLIGVALGTIGTLTGQFLATRGESRRHAERTAAQARAERKEAIAGFLDAAQRIEQVVYDRPHGTQPVDGVVTEQLHALWLAKKLLELVGSADLASVAHRYTSTLHSTVHTPSAEMRDRMKQCRGEFMEAARRELGLSGGLYRAAAG